MTSAAAAVASRPAHRRAAGRPVGGAVIVAVGLRHAGAVSRRTTSS
jgi:hypothetical protein